ncbi:DUF523 domain-containing protein [Pseudoalteromonas sp. H105]|jgi:uncharacterized protein YbbK (DUF523 family)|uniref:DUF523 domain-containing protein n=1 Tax=Pseudoalteromonas sp. H105 TaxID=1348393 RepID=UPI00073201BA|nr:DUF523 domain-containing protein [Pseudoalteromonas sp. H105]KTF09814.1 hypothetical protein ATS75_19645 [Pseudoalteromonas sp. H105]
MEKILVSSCLLGKPVRYDGTGHTLSHPQITTWQLQGRIVPLCPEVAGGLPTPRPAAEIIEHRVMTIEGGDVTTAFKLGAQKALQICMFHNIRFALLKESSPSCGRNTIYDGTHKGNKIAGMGLTAEILVNNGIEVFSESQMPALIKALAKD